MTFEDMEKAFYKIHCTDHVNAQNARYEAQRHPERCKSLDDYRKAPQTCPEETIYMIGNKDNHIPAEMLKTICSEFIDWEQKRFPGVHVLSVAMHCDEEGSPHIHERKAWLYVDKDGHTQKNPRAGTTTPNKHTPNCAAKSSLKSAKLTAWN